MKLTLKDKILFGTIIALILLLIFNNWKFNRMQEKMYAEIQEGNKMIVEMDKTKKEADGQYAKLVDYFNTEKDLNKELKDQNKELYNLIKDQDEKILMMNNSIISLRGEINQGDITVNEEDSTVFDMAIKYPNDENPFINWNGSIFTKTKTYKGEWSFGKLPLQVILTETDRGLWNSRLIGPDWLIVDSIEVKSLPPSEFNNDPGYRNFGFIGGGGYIHSFTSTIPSGISVGGGVYFKNHNIILNATTNQSVGLSYYYKFQNKKKRK